MIRAHSPQQALADALGGYPIGPNHIAVGPHLVSTRLAMVFVDNVPVGRWNDGTDELVERIRLVTGWKFPTWAVEVVS